MSAAAKAVHESMTERKTILIDSLWRKFRTLAVSTQLAAVAAQGAGGSVSGSAAPAGVAAAAAIAAVAAPSDDDSETRLLSDVLAAMGAPDAEFTDTVAALEAWVNPADNAYALLGIEKALRANEPARALEILTKLLATPKVCRNSGDCHSHARTAALPRLHQCRHPHTPSACRPTWRSACRLAPRRRCAPTCCACWAGACGRSARQRRTS